MFSYLSPEQRVPVVHPLRTIRAMTDDALRRLSPGCPIAVEKNEHVFLSPAAVDRVLETVADLDNHLLTRMSPTRSSRPVGAASGRRGRVCDDSQSVSTRKRFAPLVQGYQRRRDVAAFLG